MPHGDKKAIGLMRAEFQRSYLMRYLVLAAVCLGLGVWFAYDGFIGYPQQLEYAEAYAEIQKLPSREIEQRWTELTAEKGWPSKLPSKSAEEIQSDIYGQYFWSALSFLVGIPALLLVIRSRGTWVEPTETGLTTSWGQSMNYVDVQSLNKRKWAKKGIARATYRDGNTTRTFTFDDFKYDREPIGEMLRSLEAVLKPEQITGGPPEGEPASPVDSSAGPDDSANS